MRVQVNSLVQRAEQLRRLEQSSGADVSAQVTALRNEAAVDPAALKLLDDRLGQLFPDRFGPADGPPRTIQAGAAAAGFGGTQGAVGRRFALNSPEVVLRDQVAARLGDLLSTTPPPVPVDVQFPKLSSRERAAARQSLEADLAGVTVHGPGGAPVSLLDKVQGHPRLSAAQKERILHVLAEVKRGYDVAAENAPAPPGYQTVNWKHTRLELDRVLDVVDKKGLSPTDSESALLASAFSDAVKTPTNFLLHNVHGAQAALHVLSRLSPPPGADQLEDIARATLEHQIGPPGFMAFVGMQNALKGAGVEKPLVDSIVAKVANPLEQPLHDDGRGIQFSPEEQAALARIGVPAWTVPDPKTRHHELSRAVIDGDSLVNYACPDGWAKLCALHGPDQPPFLQEPLLKDGLTSEQDGIASAKRSFLDARRVVSPDILPLYEAGLERTEAAVGRVLASVTAWAEGSGLSPAGGDLPYLTTPLDYHDPAQLDFARQVRERVVAGLREEENR